MKKSSFLSVLAAAFLCPTLAFATGADDKAAAQVLFDEGRKLMDKGQFAEACTKLETSQRLDPGAGTLVWLATCYDKNGQTASAWVTYTDAATASEGRHPDWATRSNDRAKALFPTLSHLTIEIPNAPTGLDVKRDGKTIQPASYGMAMPIDPGHHVIDANAPGKLPFHKEIDVAGQAATASVTIKLDAAPVEGGGNTGGNGNGNVITQPPPPKDNTGDGLRAGGLAIAGVGVAGVIVGAIFGGLAMGKKSDASANCTSDLSRCNTAGKNSVDDAYTLATISTIAFVAGGVLAAGGLVLFVIAPHSKEAKAALHVSPFGVSLQGEF